MNRWIHIVSKGNLKSRGLILKSKEEHNRKTELTEMKMLHLTLPVGLLLAAGLFLLPQEDQIRGSIWLSLVEYFAAASLMLFLSREDWRINTLRGKVARNLWTLACLTYLVHVALSFHYIHHWSHIHAFEHVKRSSGFGEGIFVSYTFTLIWTVDVMWWWIDPASYADRSVWIDRCLHVFMAFILFNGAVVFAAGISRGLGIILFLGLSLALVLRWISASGSHGRIT